MNDILNRGFVSPYIDFRFGNGNAVDTFPPRYFASFKQTRTTSKACSFTLTLSYAPGNFNETTASIIHNVLLSAVQLPVTYRYGYRTPGGGLQLQNKSYAGIFVQYNEAIQSDGTLVYTVTGVAHAVEDTGTIYNVTRFLEMFSAPMMQPSKIVDLLTDPDYRNNDTGINEVFKDYQRNIDSSDEEVPFSDIRKKISSGTIHDLFIGKTNITDTTYPNGIVSLSYKLLGDQDILASNLLSQDTLTSALAYTPQYISERASEEYVVRNYVSTSVGESTEYVNRRLENLRLKEAYNEYARVKKMPYVCFFDNVVDSVTSTGKGTFNYLPKMGRQITNIFNYNYGNCFLDSDVISFDATYDGAKAIASVSALRNVASNIDPNGQQISSSYIVGQPDGFQRNTFSTLSGFDESSFLTDTMLADALNYAFKANMTVVGQTDCNDLMDTIRVNVFVNGVEHPGMSGDYSIIGIEDNLSESGFTTTFELVKTMTLLVSDSEMPAYVSNKTTEDGGLSEAAQNQKVLDETKT